MNGFVRASLLALTALACGGRPGPGVPAAPPPASTALDVHRFATDSGSFAGNSGYETPATVVIGDAGAWAAAWGRIHEGQQPLPPLPSVDFSNRMVVLVAIGQQPNGGHSVRLTGAAPAGDTLLIRAEHRSPGAGCFTTQALVEPVDIATIARTSAPIRFDVRGAVYSCGPSPE